MDSIWRIRGSAACPCTGGSFSASKAARHLLSTNPPCDPSPGTATPNIKARGMLPRASFDGYDLTFISGPLL